jgi:hypothetical protein
MSGYNTCYVCGHKNEPYVAECAECGALLRPAYDDAITERLSQYVSPSVREGHFAPDPSKVPDQTLAFFALGKAEPILTRASAEIILGRSVIGFPAPTIDLTAYGAQELGVSRQHAKITYVNGTYHLVDLDSTNGTWLNEEKLVSFKPRPVKSTDQIRLGQLRLFIFFRAGDTIDELAEKEDRLVLASPGYLMTPDILARMLSPYLGAIAELQHIIDQARGVDPHHVSISRIDSGPPLSIKLRGASDAIELLKNTIRTLHFKTSGAAPAEQSTTSAPVPEKAGEAVTRLPFSKEEAEQRLRNLHPRSTKRLAEIEQEIPGRGPGAREITREQVEMASQVLKAIAPDLSEQDRLLYVARLLPVLDALVHSFLSLSVQ